MKTINVYKETHNYQVVLGSWVAARSKSHNGYKLKGVYSYLSEREK